MLGKGDEKVKTLEGLFQLGKKIKSANRRGYPDIKIKSQVDIHWNKGDVISPALLVVLKKIIKICGKDIKNIFDKTHRDNTFEINYKETSLIIDDNEVIEENQLLHMDSYINNPIIPSEKNINFLINLDINEVIDYFCLLFSEQ